MNAWHVELHTGARVDYLEALDWYLERSVLVAQRFQDEFRSLLTCIANNPELAPADTDGIRWRRMDRFPHVIYYRLKDLDTVQVLAVSHGRRDPDYWKPRM